MIIKLGQRTLGTIKPAFASDKRKRRSFGLLAQMRGDWAAVLGPSIITILVLLALFAPIIAPFDPIKTNPTQRLQGPDIENWFGTDELGRDILSRLLWGARLFLGTVTVAAFATMLIGVLVGTVAGYYGGSLDDVLMRIVDILLAFPGLSLALAIVGTLGPSVRNVVLGFVAVWWASYARVTRSLVLSIRERDYIEATCAIGALSRRILGLVAQPPTPEGGAMLNAGRRLLQRAPQLMIYPGLAISLAVLGFNLLGDGLRDALDPYLKV